MVIPAKARASPYHKTYDPPRRIRIPGSAASFDHFVGASEERRRDGNVEGCSCLEVNHELVPGGLLDRQVGWLGSPQNPVHVGRRSPVEIESIRSIAHQSTGEDVLFRPEHARQTVPKGEFG